MKKIILSLGLLFLFSFSFAVNVEFKPIYSDARFQPNNAFHAWCVNTVDVVFSLETNSSISALNAILEYNPSELNILSILPSEQKKLNLTYTIQDGKITLNKLKSDAATSSATTVVFTISFKTISSSVSSSSFSFVQGSYLVDNLWKMIALEWTSDFSFVAVPECEPDILPPTIEIIYPSEKKKELPLDSYFTFAIKDDWKWINKDSLVITIDNIVYSADTIDFTWKNDQVTFLPNFRLPLDSDVTVAVKVSDKQVYGWSNITEKKYVFHTATWLSLLNNIDLNDFRLLVGMWRAVHWTQKECTLLQDIYAYSNVSYQKNIASIGKRILCDAFSSWSVTDTILPTLSPEKLFTLPDTKSSISLFSFIGWLLFFVSLLLKLFYMYWYKKHKNLVKKHWLLE